MAIKNTRGDRVFIFFNTVFMVILMVVTLYPMLYVAFASISDPTSMIQHTGLLLYPLGFQLDGYKMVMDNPMILEGYRNTIAYVLIGTAINLIMTCLGAYVLSRKKFGIKKVLTLAIIFTMFFNGGLIPTFLTVRDLGMYNSIWALVIPNAISTYNLIIMRTSFMSIPETLEEAAVIDGANDFVILFRVVIPLSMPVVAVMILFYGVSHWNSWFNAMIYIRDRSLYPLQLILREILVSSSTESMTASVGNMDKEPVSEIVKYATIMVATVPILFIYPFLQRFFVKGVMIGAVKG